MVVFLNGCTIKDRIPTEQLLAKADMLSVNQLNTYMKLLEICKATNLNNYPLKVQRQMASKDAISTRATTKGRLYRDKISVFVIKASKSQ